MWCCRLLKDSLSGYFPKHFLPLPFGGYSSNTGSALFPYSSPFRRLLCGYRANPNGEWTQLQPRCKSGSNVRLFSSESKGEQDKPLHEWTKEEVQEWFREDAEFAQYGPKFRAFSGRSLARMSKEDFIRRCPELGEVIYNQLSTIKYNDPYLVLKSLKETQGERPFPDPPTDMSYPYQNDNRDVVVKLWGEVVLRNWRSRQKVKSKDKKAWCSAFIYGGSGLGKTRFALELTRLLIDHAATLPPNQQDVQQLCEALQNSETVVLNLRHNDSALNPWETEWPANTILGLRLACEYWFPGVNYQGIAEKIHDLSKTDPSILRTFSLRVVMEMIGKYPPPSTTANPHRKIPKLLHVCVDEIQTAFNRHVTYQGSRNSEGEDQTEPLSKALNRTLMDTVSSLESKAPFLLATCVGTAVQHTTECLEPTDYPFISFPLHMLTLDSAVKLVRSFKSDNGTEIGKAWLSMGNPFLRLLALSGGHPRALQCLHFVLQDQEFSDIPKSIPEKRIIAMWIATLDMHYNMNDSWGSTSTASFGLLLALSGVPVTRELVIFSHDRKSPQITIDKLERAGVFTLRPYPTGQWTSKLRVIDMPLILVLAAKQQVEEAHPHYYKDFSEVLNFHHNLATFESSAIGHYAFRYRVASLLALHKGLDYVPAVYLFGGSICKDEFALLQFKPDTRPRDIFRAIGIQITEAEVEKTKTVPKSIQVEEFFGTQESLQLDGSTPFALVLGHGNSQSLLDGVLNIQVHEGKKIVPALLWIDTKFGWLTTKDTINPSEIEPLVNKRKLIEQHWNATGKHILAIVTNKPVASSKHTTSSQKAEKYLDNQTCLLSSSDDGLACAFSPALAIPISTYYSLNDPKQNSSTALKETTNK